MAQSDERHGEILNLLMTMFSGTKDEYGKEVVPPLPLSFDRVNEGRPPCSTAQLFRLPFEVLAVILQHIPSGSLASFAMVNRDCRQLARSRQFASIHLNYSQHTFSLLLLLMDEKYERAKSGGSIRLPSLGACIRRITVSTHPGWVTYRHGVALDRQFIELSEDIKTRRLASAYNMFFCNYLPIIESVLSDRTTMPYLELLDWEDKIVLPCSFFNALARSSIRHLKLFRVQLEEEFEIELPKALSSYGWPLRSLYLEVGSCLSKKEKINTSMLCTSMLRLCAPTLESFRWESAFTPDECSFWTTTPDSVPSFASIRDLALEYVQVADPSILIALVQDRLRTLKTDIAENPIYTTFFQKRGSIPALQTFIWSALRMPVTQPLDFLRANAHLLKLRLECPTPGSFLDSQLLPLLSISFSKLTSLSLVWEDTNISNSALETISSLRTLKQIHLSAGNQFGWRHNWLITHGLIRKQLRKLTCLGKIAFSRDSYSDGQLPSTCDYYYEDKFFWRHRPITPEIREKKWERIHRKRMLIEANRYIRKMPRLKWLYFGQIPMSVEKLQGAEGKHAVALSYERDDCSTLLSNIFGWQTDLLP